MEKLLTAAEVSEVLNISARSLQALVARGEAPINLRVGRTRRWRPSDVSAWLEDRLTRAPPKSNLNEDDT
jgi:excisionase family DNA binding protein